MLTTSHPKQAPAFEAVARQAASSFVPPEEQGRANLYVLAGRLLLGADRPVLARLSELALTTTGRPPSDAPLAAALQALGTAALELGAEGVQREFDALFVSTGKPPVNPYESLYLTGFMMEKPLAALRQELTALGLRRSDSIAELEDHLGALCETMCLLITGGEPLARQQVFFERHIEPWQARCLDDIRAAPGAHFYLRLAELMAVFFDIEAQAFEIGESGLLAPA